MYNRKNIPFQRILSFQVYLGDDIPGGLGVGIETFGHNSEYSATNKWEKKLYGRLLHFSRVKVREGYRII